MFYNKKRLKMLEKQIYENNPKFYYDLNLKELRGVFAHYKKVKNLDISEPNANPIKLLISPALTEAMLIMGI